MSPPNRRCRGCQQAFTPDSRNRHHQHYCSQPPCRLASKKNSQKQWLKKPENRRYFHGPENVRRVQEWRQAHPGYWKRGKTTPPLPPQSLSENGLQEIGHAIALQDFCLPQPPPAETVTTPQPRFALQDIMTSQQFVIQGVIAHLLGQPLQDVIDPFLQACYDTGKAIPSSFWPSSQPLLPSRSPHAQTPALSRSPP